MIALLLMVLWQAPGDGAPRVVRERTEWLDVWVPDNDISDKPRVLLIGDSITRGYGPLVEAKLKGRALVARLATSKSLGDPALLLEVRLVLEQTKFDVVHFNNGMHGWGYTEDENAGAFPAILELIKSKAPKAELIWALTTPVRKRDDASHLDPKTDRVRERNARLAKLIEGKGVATNDLFAATIDHPEFFSADGIHFAPAGNTALADQVVRAIERVLP